MDLAHSETDRAHPAAALAGGVLRASLLLLTVLVAGSCVTIKNYGPPEGPKPGAEQPDQAKEKQEEEKEHPFEPWEKVLKDTRAIEGFFTLHLKRDRTLFLEVPPSRLGEDFGMVTHYSRGVGALGLQEGLPAYGGTHLMELRRQGDELYLVRLNPRFKADSGSAMEISMERNVGHSVLAAFPIESKHDSTDHLLVDVTDFFVSDYTNNSDFLQFYYGGKPVRFDEKRSHVEKVQAFPENVEIDAFLTYEASGFPLFGGPSLSDVRSIPVGIRYSLFELPEDPMEPRPADVRVGHFLTAREDFSRDESTSPMERYVNRWRLEKKDHAAELAEPVEPIVYYIDRSVPERYRPHVKQGIEAWNEAFREAGFEDAVVAKMAPTEEEDPDWSAEDVRYSTVRWTAAHSMGYAIGPSQADPRTGELLNADILVSWVFVQSWLREYQDLVTRSAETAGLAAGPGGGFGSGTGGYGLSGLPVASSDRSGSGRGLALWSPFGASPTAAQLAGPAGALWRYRALERVMRRTRPGVASRLCAAEMYRAQQLGVQYAVLAARGLIEPGEKMPEEYLGAAIKDLIMHEVGHTLGLRHNFKGSSAIPYERLHDESFTREHGVSLSVMEYNPVNLAGDGSRQGHYWNPSVGSYDEWVVKYAYAPVYRQPEDGSFAMSGEPATSDSAKRAALAKIAGQSDDPMHAYGTDEDARFGPWAVDPLTNTGDLGSDPLRYARDRNRLVEDVLPNIEDRLVAEGESWHRLREGVTSLYFDKWYALLSAPKMVGGLYVARDYRGQPGGRTPFRHVSADRQREAVELLAQEAFGEDAFLLDPETLNRLAPDRWWDWRLSFTDLIPIDYPVHRQVLSFQQFLLSDLFHPERLHRLVDNEVRAPSGMEPFTMSELFRRITQAVWAEVQRPSRPREIGSFRRNLQRAHMERLTTLLLHEAVAGFAGKVTVPEDARSLARAELRELSGEIETALGAGGDLSRATRAHLEESKARIDRALEASVSLELEPDE